MKSAKVSAARPIPIDKKAVGEFVEGKLIPQIVNVLETLSLTGDKQAPLGNMTKLAHAWLEIDRADKKKLGKLASKIMVGVTVDSKAQSKKYAAVIGGKASIKKSTWQSNGLLVEVTLYINGALSPADILEGTEVKMGQMGSYKHNRLQSLKDCTALTCLPFGLYSTLIHEATHAAESVFGWSKGETGTALHNGETVVTDQAKYINDPVEVRAWMQQIVDEVLFYLKKFDEVEGLDWTPQKRIQMALKTSTTWQLVKSDLTPKNRNLIMKAVYTAVQDQKVVKAQRALFKLRGWTDIQAGDEEPEHFWGNQGAGGLFYAEDTGRVLVQHRSAAVNEPNTWGVWGGKIDDDEKPEEALKREIEEEAEYRGHFKLIPVHTFKKGSFQFHNFLIVVPHEFDPKHSWESQGHVWTSLDEMPTPLHFGLKQALPGFKAVVARLQTPLAAAVRALDAAAEVLARDLNRPDFKRFYVAIPFDDYNEHNARKLKDLAHGVLNGIQGISHKHEIIMQWYGIARDAILVMDAEKVFKINQLSRVQYDNPDYLVSRGMAPLYRIFDKTPDKGGTWGLATNILDYLQSAAQPLSKKKSESMEAAEKLAEVIEKTNAALDKAVQEIPEEDRDQILSNLNGFDEGDVSTLNRAATKMAEDLRSFANAYDGLSARNASLYLNWEDNFSFVKRYESYTQDVTDAIKWTEDVFGPEVTQKFVALIDALKNWVSQAYRFQEIRRQADEEIADVQTGTSLFYELQRGGLKTDMEDVLRKTGFENVKTAKGLAKMLMEAAKSSKRSSVDLPLPVWEKLTRKALLKIGKVYSEEGEWLVKDQSLKVPHGSVLFVTGTDLPPEVEERRKAGTLTKQDEFIFRPDIEAANKRDATIRDLHLDKRYKIHRISRKKFDAARSAWLNRPKKG